MPIDRSSNCTLTFLATSRLASANPTRIDLRSDTVTQPTAAMRKAMAEAVVGDDVFGEDPTINRLQERCAELTGKDAALFVASGTMGNLISVLAHCQRSDEVILGNRSHIAIWEQAGVSAFGGVSLRTIHNGMDGTLSLADIQGAINDNDQHRARTALIALENTFMGTPLSIAYMASVRQLALANNLAVHLDGARIFNAALALSTDVSQLAAQADSIQFCFSKGLRAPAGSIIAGSHTFIGQARRLRKALGGGMRQAGVLAAACLEALDSCVDRLAQDHQNAEHFALGLSAIDDIDVVAQSPRTNMVFFKSKTLDSREFARRLGEIGILVTQDAFMGIRSVMHADVSKADVDEALQRIASL